MVGTTDRNEVARERLRTAVREALDAASEGALTVDDAEQAIMDATQQWVVEGYAINAGSADPCPGSGTYVGREYAPHGWKYTDAADVPDPGPFTVGEHITCKYCRADVPVARVKTTERETMTQYIAWLADH